MCDKMAISAYILKIVERDPFLRLQMRAKEDGRFVEMATKDLQTFNIKFYQVTFNSLVYMWKRNFEILIVTNFLPQISSNT